jgi:hypothetical protein
VILLLKISDFAGFLKVIFGEFLATRSSSQLTGGRCDSYATAVDESDAPVSGVPVCRHSAGAPLTPVVSQRSRN